MYLTEVGHFCFHLFHREVKSPAFRSKGSGGDGNIDGKKKRLGECSAKGGEGKKHTEKSPFGWLRAKALFLQRLTKYIDF